MGLLDGKRILVTGVLTDDSLAFAAARIAQEQGADIVLTGAGRGMGLTRRVARRLPTEPDVWELDVTEPAHVEAVRRQLVDKWGRVDGALHAIGFAPPSCLGGGFMDAPWEDVAIALQISTYSLKVLAELVAPLMPDGGSIVGLDFDNSTQAWPAYDWMGVAKAGLEATMRYLAKTLGPQAIRVNLVAAGPIRTIAAKSIPAFAQFEDVWNDRAPLGWDVKGDHEAVGRACVALLSDWFPKTTGEMVHVDGGFHAVGA
ncbi:MAG TPA: enoyl-ACP reductase FabI [Acidimicrobiales bacterium]|jgi:enoyl-[acyl-carrier protein] reductase I|nr:enoyl-ACP reductase FabI [Acidimicrobiales bacterium]